MSEFPECLQPAVEQIAKYENKISALEDEKQSLHNDIKSLSDEKDELSTKIEDETAAHTAAVQKYEKEKLTLRELNIVVSNQLREKVDELNALGAGQEASSHQTSRLNAEIEELRQQNKRLQNENSALKAGNIPEYDGKTTDLSKVESSELSTEIERLKQELRTYKNDNSDVAFLQEDNARLVQRHGEITQEKMQASAKMHSAQKELLVANETLESAQRSLEQHEFEYQGLQNLYKNLTAERDALIADNGSLVNAKAELIEKVKHLGEQIQRISSEKELIIEELNKEHVKADAMAEEVNRLRIKSRTLAEDNKVLKEGHYKTVLQDTPAVEVPVLEIDTPEDSAYGDYDIEIVETTRNSGPHFPGESHDDEVK